MKKFKRGKRTNLQRYQSLVQCRSKNDEEDFENSQEVFMENNGTFSISTETQSKDILLLRGL